MYLGIKSQKDGLVEVAIVAVNYWIDADDQPIDEQVGSVSIRLVDGKISIRVERDDEAVAGAVSLEVA